jgi:hypothetical protein
MPYLGSSPARGLVGTADIDANAVDGTLTKDALIADYSDVTITASDLIMYGDATDSNNTKRDTVQGILDLASGGAWTLIGTQVASSDASLTVTGLSSTYDTYAVAGSDLHPENDDVDAYIQFGDSSGIDSGASDYAWRYENDDIDSTSPSEYHDRDNADSEIQINRTAGDSGIGNAAGEGIGFVAFIHNPGDSTMYTTISGNYASITPSTTLQPGTFHGMRSAVITTDRILFKFSGGTIISGRLTVWGISHA